MKSIKITLNFLISFFSIYIITSIWATFYIKNKLAAIFISLFLSAIGLFFLQKIFEKNQVKTKNQQKNKKMFNSFCIHITSLNNAEFKTFLNQIFEGKIDEKNNVLFYKNSLLVLAQNKNLTKSDIVFFCALAKKNGTSKIIITSTECNEKLKVFSQSINNFQITFLEPSQMFNLAKEKNIEFENLIEFKTGLKPTLKKFLDLMFAKKNAKHFLLFGLLSYLTSFLTIFKLYYYVFTTLFLVFALICLFKKQPPQISDNLF